MSVAGLLAGPALAGPPAASAPDPAVVRQVEGLAAEAEKAFAAGDFQTAVDRYAQAHALDPSAALLLYNIAFIYDRHLAQPALAVTFYRKYRETPKAEVRRIIKASERIEALQIELAQAEADQAAQAAEAAAAQEAERRAALLAQAESEADEAAPTVYVFRPLDDRRSKWSRAVGWTLLGVGVAGLAGGGLLAWQADEAQADFDAARTARAKAAAKDEGRGYAVGADVAIAAGLASLVGGAVLLWLADEPGTLRPEPVVPGVMPAATLTAEGAALGLQGVF
ncbi:MAG: hypothetical protein KC613_05675 [Myxococcales bacterium]|nr:hypothetical protein [Myxococcales bacterium]